MKTACDGLAALNKVGVNAEYIKCSAKHVDMISMISELWNISSFTPLPEHVYGHQDTSKGPLSMLAILNNKMDVMAKQIALDYIGTRPMSIIVPTSLGIGTIICGGNLVTSRVQQTFYHSIMHD